MKRLFVGNLPWSVDDAQLAQIFSSYGDIASAEVKKGPDGRSKGFAFVELGEEMAEKAITELNGKEVDGRAITVDLARPPSENRGPRSRFDNNRGGGNYGRSGNRGYGASRSF